MSDSPFKQPTQGGGAYIKLDQFDDQLVLFLPKSVDQVPAYKKPKELVDEVTADWVAFGPDGYDETPGAKFKGANLVRAANQALKDPEHPWVLGVLQKVATKETKDKYKIDYTPEAFKKLREEWLRKGAPDPKPGHVWTLSPFSDEQGDQARKYIEAQARKTNPFTSPAAE